LADQSVRTSWSEASTHPTRRRTAPTSAGPSSRPRRRNSRDELATVNVQRKRSFALPVEFWLVQVGMFLNYLGWGWSFTLPRELPAGVRLTPRPVTTGTAGT